MKCIIWNLASVQLETVLVSMKIGAWFVPSAPYALKPLWTFPMVLLSEEAQVKARFALFGDSANLDAR